MQTAPGKTSAYQAAADAGVDLTASAVNRITKELLADERYPKTPEVQLGLSMEAVSRASTQTMGSPRFTKLADPDLRKNLYEAVANSRTVKRILSDPAELQKMRDAMTDPARRKEFCKRFAQPFMSVLDRCPVPPSQDPKARRDTLRTEAKKYGLSLAQLARQAQQSKCTPEAQLTQLAEAAREKLTADKLLTIAVSGEFDRLLYTDQVPNSQMSDYAFEPLIREDSFSL